MADHRGVFICGELGDEKLTHTTREILNIGRRLCDDLNQDLTVLLAGQNIQKAATEAISLGADNVYTALSAPFSESLPDHFVDIIISIVKKVTPSIILLGQTDMGRDIAPRLAVRLGAGCCLDCVELRIDPKTRSLLQTKPVYGGKAMAVWASENGQPQVVTMRPRAASPAKPNPSRKGQIIPLSAEIDEHLIKGKLLKTVREEAKGIRLEEAKVIVAGGGGIGGSEGFQLIRELAQVLGGAVGITRVPSDEGWMPASLEIGQTGHIVGPKLYLAVGISGAPQHLAGCSSSRFIVAINKDAEAHIFKVSDFGIVGDYREVLPALIKKCKALFAT